MVRDRSQHRNISSEVIYRKDYLSAPEHSFARATNGGNSDVDTTFEAYPGAVFVDYHFYSSAKQGLDWSTLRLVFQS